VTVDAHRDSYCISYADGLKVPGREAGSDISAVDAQFRKAIDTSMGDLVDLRSSDLSRSTAALSATGAGLASMISVPLVNRGKPVGVFNVFSRDPGAYGSKQLNLAQSIGTQVSYAIANSLIHEEAMEFAGHQDDNSSPAAEIPDLQRLDQAKIRFLSMVSHELRTPLTSMMAFADILKQNKQGNLTEKDISRVDVIRRNGRSLSQLIGDLLDVSRIESGSLKMAFADFEVNQMLGELQESFTPLVEAKNQRLKLDLPVGGVNCFADRERIAQVVSNLVSNASKYSPDSTEIRVAMHYNTDNIEISVTDAGLGISEHDQNQLFTSFFRAENDETRRESGTGLGLVIVKGIMDMHDGDVWIESEVGQGTTAHIRFSRRCVAPLSKDRTDHAA
jgi:signal transduction histidine kinase